jgi:NAD(P)-dependent dehydrogenase (short-subunit alcohol dehydrogenase family)
MMAPAPIPSFDLTDQVALITGAGRGIGAAIATGLASAGARAVLSARGEAQLEAVAGEIQSMGGAADVLPWDLSAPDPAGLVAACVRRHGRIDVLVHAAGNQVRKPVLDYTPGDFDAVLAVHLRAAFELARAAGREMAAQGGGAIVFVGSLTSERLGNPRTVGYAAAKSGLLGLMRTFAVELAPLGVRVNTLIPGFVATEMTRDVDNTPERAKLTDRIPAGRLGAPADLAGPAVFLASPAAAYVTSAVLTVDGGWTAA